MSEFQSIVDKNKKYTYFSWSAQEAANPIAAGVRAQGTPKQKPPRLGDGFLKFRVCACDQDIVPLPSIPDQISCSPIQTMNHSQPSVPTPMASR